MRDIYYSIALKLKGERVLVAGGGKVAERKVKTLLQFGARVRVVSPDLTLPLKRLFKFGRITWAKRVFLSGDIRGARLVIAATSQPKVNKEISRQAKRRGVLVNVVDNAKLSSFISPAFFLAGKANIAVNTNAKDPLFSKDLRDFLQEYWDEFLSYRDRL